VLDVASAFQAVLDAPRELVHDQALNIGADELNYQIRELGEIAAGAVPGCELAFVADPGADHRTYKADFSKFRKFFPSFRFRWTAREGAQELYATFERIGLKNADYVDKRFTRLRWLRHQLDSGALDATLRHTDRPARTHQSEFDFVGQDCREGA
jgi:hypothetical protein